MDCGKIHDTFSEWNTTKTVWTWVTWPPGAHHARRVCDKLPRHYRYYRPKRLCMHRSLQPSEQILFTNAYKKECTAPVYTQIDKLSWPVPTYCCVESSSNDTRCALVSRHNMDECHTCCKRVVVKRVHIMLNLCHQLTSKELCSYFSNRMWNLQREKLLSSHFRLVPIFASDFRTAIICSIIW